LGNTDFGSLMNAVIGDEDGSSITTHPPLVRRQNRHFRCFSDQSVVPWIAAQAREDAESSPETARKLLVSGTAKTPENFPRFFSGPVQERCDVER